MIYHNSNFKSDAVRRLLSFETDKMPKTYDDFDNAMLNRVTKIVAAEFDSNTMDLVHSYLESTNDMDGDTVDEIATVITSSLEYSRLMARVYAEVLTLNTGHVGKVPVDAQLPTGARKTPGLYESEAMNHPYHFDNDAGGSMTLLRLLELLQMV